MAQHGGSWENKYRQLLSSRLPPSSLLQCFPSAEPKWKSEDKRSLIQSIQVDFPGAQDRMEKIREWIWRRKQKILSAHVISVWIINSSLSRIWDWKHTETVLKKEYCSWFMTECPWVSAAEESWAFLLPFLLHIGCSEIQDVSDKSLISA